jgi:hypothetical protein
VARGIVEGKGQRFLHCPKPSRSLHASHQLENQKVRAETTASMNLLRSICLADCCSSRANAGNTNLTFWRRKISLQQYSRTVYSRYQRKNRHLLLRYTRHSQHPHDEGLTKFTVVLTTLFLVPRDACSASTLPSKNVGPNMYVLSIQHHTPSHVAARTKRMVLSYRISARPQGM